MTIVCCSCRCRSEVPPIIEMDVHALYRRQLAGEKIEALAEEVGCSERTLQSRFNAHGLVPRRGPAPYTAGIYQTAEQLIDKGKTQREVAAGLGYKNKRCIENLLYRGRKRDRLSQTHPGEGQGEDLPSGHADQARTGGGDVPLPDTVG